MNRSTAGILIMLNNYFHDLAAGLLFSSGWLAWVLRRRWAGCTAANGAVEAAIVRDLTRATLASLAWVIVGGVVRTANYREYEWMAAAGKGQIPALIAKHVVLVATVGAGLGALVDLRRRAGARA